MSRRGHGLFLPAPRIALRANRQRRRQRLPGQPHWRPLAGGILVGTDQLSAAPVGPSVVDALAARTLVKGERSPPYTRKGRQRCPCEE